MNETKQEAGQTLSSSQELMLQDDDHLLPALRSGDERAFALLIDKYYGSLLRLAMAYVPSRAVAEEVVQETWLGVFEGLPRF